MTPRVTVLIPLFNGAATIRDAVESVLAQTFGDFELLVVDDGGTDGSFDIVRSYADTRIRLLRNAENMGQTRTLNRGLQEAQGEYIARLDQDDLCLPRRLERQVAVLDDEPQVALVGTWLDVVDERGRLWARVRGRVRDFPEFLFAILADRYPFSHPSLMFRRDVVVALGGYDPALAPAEDKDLYRRVALARHDARAIEQPLVRYRRHEQQLSQTQVGVQKHRDREGQERFLSQLVGEGDARPLRVLLETGTNADGRERELLGGLLAGAGRRLDLSAAELARLEGLLAGHLARRAVAAGPSGHRTLMWASRHRPWALSLAPLLAAMPVLHAGGRLARRAARSPRLAPLRRRARRLRLLRSLYSRLGPD